MGVLHRVGDQLANDEPDGQRLTAGNGAIDVGGNLDLNNIVGRQRICDLAEKVAQIVAKTMPRFGFGAGETAMKQRNGFDLGAQTVENRAGVVAAQGAGAAAQTVSLHPEQADEHRQIVGDAVVGLSSDRSCWRTRNSRRWTISASTSACPAGQRRFANC